VNSTPGFCGFSRLLPHLARVLQAPARARPRQRPYGRAAHDRLLRHPGVAVRVVCEAVRRVGGHQEPLSAAQLGLWGRRGTLSHCARRKQGQVNAAEAVIHLGYFTGVVDF
jgi:hypothetical protein